MAIDPRDLGEMQKALNDASGKASALWTTFVTFALYLLISFGSVTHRDLFLENPVRLPLLNVELPLTAFFAVAPAVFVIFHFYVCLQLFGLARRTVAYNTLLRSEVDTEAQRQMLRQRIDLFLVAQFLAGPRAQRVGLVGLSLRFIAWVTIVAAPVAVLLVAQLTFLPYHAAPVSWVQRLCLLIDLAVIWFFWKRIRDGDDPILPRVPPKVWEGIGIATTVLIAWFSVGVAYFPGELAERVGLDRWPFGNVGDAAAVQSLNTLVFRSEVDAVTGRQVGFLANRLVLPGETFATTTEQGGRPARRVFIGRDLSYAILDRTDLSGGDFSAVDLRHAQLIDTKFGGAKFLAAHLDDVVARRASLVNINFAMATLDRADLIGTDVTGARFVGATLNGALFDRAEMLGAAFYFATVLGAQFTDAVLDGSLFIYTDLRGSSFAASSLLGAQFRRNCLDLTNFYGADLSGARIDSERPGPFPEERQFASDLQMGARARMGILPCRAEGSMGIDFSGAHLRRSVVTVSNISLASWADTVVDNEPLPDEMFTALTKRITSIESPLRRDEVAAQVAILSAAAPRPGETRRPAGILVAAGESSDFSSRDGADKAALAFVATICAAKHEDAYIAALQPSLAPVARAQLKSWIQQADIALGKGTSLPSIRPRSAAAEHNHFSSRPLFHALFIEKFMGANTCQAIRDQIPAVVLAGLRERASALGYALPTP